MSCVRSLRIRQEAATEEGGDGYLNGGVEGRGMGSPRDLE